MRNRSGSCSCRGVCPPTPSRICTQRTQSNPDYFYPEYLFTADGSVCLSHRQRIGRRADFIASDQPIPPFFSKKGARKKINIDFLCPV